MAVSFSDCCVDTGSARRSGPTQESLDLKGIGLIKALDDRPSCDRDPVTDRNVGDEQDGRSPPPAVALDEGAAGIDIDHAAGKCDAHL
ncbi:MAG TPA: hypothetical protein VGQ02_09385, partial [Candidatus Limnocylindrales bacterium]|nr:hypothetical protein [Candidatus Limnocylindrales bacterium]